MTLYRDDIDSPVGRLSILVDDSGALHMLAFDDGRDMRHLEATGAVRRKDPGGVSTVLRRYFKGDRTAIDALPVKPTGTPFQLSVWAALREIPCGETRSYGDIARRIGNPTAVRAVGLANGANPIAVVVPCHRVIGANGSLTGYGGGLPRKKWLLAHESNNATLNLEMIK